MRGVAAAAAAAVVVVVVRGRTVCASPAIETTVFPPPFFLQQLDTPHAPVSFIGKPTFLIGVSRENLDFLGARFPFVRPRSSILRFSAA